MYYLLEGDRYCRPGSDANLETICVIENPTAGLRYSFYTIYLYNVYTVESRYLELGNLEFCECQSVYLNQKYIFITLSNHNFALETFFTSPNYPKCKLICT